MRYRYQYQYQKQLPTVPKPYIPEQPLIEPVQKVTPKKNKKKKKKVKIKKQTMEARRLDQYPIDIDLEIFDPYYLPQLEPEYNPIVIDIQEEPYQEEPYQEEPYQEEPYQDDNILIPKHTDNLITRLWIKEYELSQCTIRKARIVELIQSRRSIQKKQQSFFSKLK